MQKIIDFLTSANRLVDETANWLAKRVRTDKDTAGAASLAHVCVVVPTAQSGRSLRLALARRFQKGILPPMVVQPMRLVVPADESLPEATDAEVAALFLKFSKMRPLRHVEDGTTVLDEWGHLFRPESFGDSSALFSFLDQLSDVWNILGAGGFLMRDVSDNEAAQSVLAGALGDEADRWAELSELEEAFFKFIHEHGLRHRAESIHLAKTAPKPLPAGIEEVVLPALVDPVPVLMDVLEHQPGDLTIAVLLHCAETERDKFDEWGRPRIECWTGGNRPNLQGLTDNDIVRAASDGQLAGKIADDFPSPGDGKLVPALCLCDDGFMSDLAGAFLSRGWELNDPEKHALNASSLGRIMGALVSLHEAVASRHPMPWAPFAALMREDDILRKLVPEDCGSDAAGTNTAAALRKGILEGIDICHNTFLPIEVPDNVAFNVSRVGYRDKDAFLAFLNAARHFWTVLRKAGLDDGPLPDFLIAALHALYFKRSLPRHEGGREFAAAAQAARQALDVVAGIRPEGLGLSVAEKSWLVRKALANASYQLEAEPNEAVPTLTTIGWLEAPWSDADKIALAGFHAGVVPQTVQGHVFLPDSLRAALGLPSNGQRLARDTFLLRSMLSSRKAGDVRAYVSRASNAGDIRRPSRLLFLVDDAHLVDRARALFGELPAAKPRPQRDIAPGWHPHLLSEVPLPGRDGRTPGGRLSPSAIDVWTKCPFTYLLHIGFGMEPEEEKEELGFDDFGTIVHAVLEAYANEQIARGDTDQLRDEVQIREALLRSIGVVRRQYGAHPSVRLKLQLDAAESRLMNFVPIQAAWAQEGWVVKDAENHFLAHPFKGEGCLDVPIAGSVDRIDWKAGVGFRLIDYKTWDDKERAVASVLSKGKDEAGHAEALGLPMLPPPLKKDGTPRKGAVGKRFLTTQLPLYRRCLEAAEPEIFGTGIADLCYLLLGKDADNTCVLGSAFDQGVFECEPRFDAKGKPKPGRIVLFDPEMNRMALDTVRRAILGIRANLFWPPGPGPKYAFESLFQFSPQRDMQGTDWLGEQLRRLEAFAGKGGRA